MNEFSRDTVRRACDAVAPDYADAFGDDLPKLPMDRAVLDATLARLAAADPSSTSDAARHTSVST